MGKFAHPCSEGAASRTVFFVRAHYCHGASVRFSRSIDMFGDNL